MNECPQCHTSLPNDKVEFCSKCGAKLKSQNQPSPPATQPEPDKTNTKNLKAMVIILAIIIIGALIAAFFIFRKSDDTTNASNTNASVNVNSQVNTNLNDNANLNVNTETTVNANANLNENINQNVNADTNQNVNEVTSTATDEVNPVRPPRDEVVVTTSSTLTDISGVGFDYSPGQVIDQDFSTSWVEAVSGDGIDEWIKMQFSAPAQINILGIVPGFARDNDIYLENNRIKSFELEFSDGTTINEELIDRYGMHFVAFPMIDTDYIKLTIKSVYKGSKYEDSPMAELDIWSDYVLAMDAQAALEYYETYKRTSALEPQTMYIDKVYMAIGIMGGATPEIPVSFYSPAMEPFIAAAEIPASTPSGITFTAKWYNEDELFYQEDITSYSAYEELSTTTISSTTHITDLLDPPNVLWPLGDYEVKWYENDKLSKSKLFAVTPQ